jgi:hypothetical protein
MCHCLECRKISSSAFTLNLTVHKDNIKIEGVSKHYPFKQELGDNFITSFCGECGTSVCMTTDLKGFEDYIIVFGGTLDEGFDANSKPEVEFFTKHRANFLSGLDGVAQVESKP